MKSMNHPRRVLLVLALALSSTTSLYAQIDMYDFSRIAATPPSQQIKSARINFMENPSETNTPTTETNYFRITMVPMSADYNYQHSVLNGTKTMNYTGSIGAQATLDFISTNLTVMPLITVSSSSTESLAGADKSDSQTISPSAQIGYALINTTADKFRVTAATAYNQTENNFPATSKISYNQASGWKFSGGLDYQHNTESNKVVMALSPSYSYTESEKVNYPTGTTSSSHLVNLQTKASIQYNFSKGFGISGYGTWLHSINLDLNPGQTDNDQDWAQFGGDIIYSFGVKEAYALDVGYSYEAFNSAYFSHDISVKFTVKF